MVDFALYVNCNILMLQTHIWGCERRLDGQEEGPGYGRLPGQALSQGRHRFEATFRALTKEIIKARHKGLWRNRTQGKCKLERATAVTYLRTRFWVCFRHCRIPTHSVGASNCWMNRTRTSTTCAICIHLRRLNATLSENFSQIKCSDNTTRHSSPRPH